MTDPITIERSQLQDIVDRAITRTLTDLGIRARDITPWITKNRASKLIGRVRLETAMEKGLVEWRKDDIRRPHSRVWIRKKDLDKLINNPQL